jgi:hypothetical protein
VRTGLEFSHATREVQHEVSYRDGSADELAISRKQPISHSREHAENIDCGSCATRWGCAAIEIT